MVLPNSWAGQLGKLIEQYGLSTQYILLRGSQAKEMFKQRVWDISVQTDMELLSKNRSLGWLSKEKKLFSSSKNIEQCVCLNLFERLLPD